MTDVFVELGVEEVPARMMEDALAQLQTGVETWAKKQRLLPEPDEPSSAGVRVCGTPRRLVVEATLRNSQRPEEEQIKGPPEQVAYDSGEPTPALEGFLRQHGLEPDDAEIEELDGGSYVVARVVREGTSLEDCLKGTLEELFLQLDWPKSMRWESSNMRFVRPIRWLICLVDDEPLGVDVGPVSSGTESRGLRFTENERFDVESARQYKTVLEGQGIVLDQEERSKTVQRQVRECASEVDGTPALSKQLREEITHLVEAPRAFLGSYSDEFLNVPGVVLRKAMVSHQKYVPVEDESGDLLPYFVGVRNGGEKGLEVVREGNEKVIRARLADAEFFYEKDRERPYDSYREELAGVVFKEELGSLREKTDRLGRLAEHYGEEGNLPDWFAESALHLKNDLVTDMVEEFPDLQGVVGRIYAEESGWEPEAARVIEEHHRPRGRDDRPAETYPGAWLAVLDRLDTLGGFFILGERPTGSSDPYGLRRDALGVLRTMLEHDFVQRIPHLLQAVLAEYAEPDEEAVLEDMVGFFQERLEQLLLEAGHEDYRIKAGVKLASWTPSSCQARVRWLAEHETDETFLRVVEMAGRVQNIVAAADPVPGDVDPALLETPEEQQLMEAVKRLNLPDELEELSDPEVLSEAMEELVTLVEPVNRFFDEVMVMVEEDRLREARLSLLSSLSNRLERVIDFSALDPIT